MEHFTIGQLAREAGVPTSTIRYYERRGLLRPDSRTGSNYRLYSEPSLERLRFVRSAQASGFTLSDITSLLEFEDSDAAPCLEVRTLITSRLERVVEQVEHLRVVDRVLRDWLRVCRAAESMGRCAVIEGLRSCEKDSEESENPP